MTKNVLKKKNAKSDTGTGLDNLRKRLNILYPDSHKLQIKKDNQIFEVKLVVNL